MPKSTNKPFKWTEKAERALQLTFEGRWTREEIAQKCTISPRTYAYWLNHPDFQARLEALRADFAASIRDITYADKARRIIALDQMAETARREFEARPWLREVRPTRDGEITNEHFNSEAHSAFRAALDDIAKEKGERSSKIDASLLVQGSMSHDVAAAIAQDPAAGDAADALLRRVTALRTSVTGGPGVPGE